MLGILVDDTYNLKVYVKLDDDGKIKQGLVIGDVLFQNQEFIIKMSPGSLKEKPLKGVGIENYQDDEDPETLLRNIRTELSADGMVVNKIGFDTIGDLFIDAKYIE